MLQDSRSVNAISDNGDEQHNLLEDQGPKVRMYQSDRRIQAVNNDAFYKKMATNTIKEMSCEGSSHEPSPLSQSSPKVTGVNTTGY